MDRKRILVITASLVVALAATFSIIHGADSRYATASRTVTAYEAAAFLPLRSVVTKAEVKAVRVPAALAPGLASAVAGRSLLASVMPGDLIFANELTGAAPLAPGLVSVSVPVDQAEGDGVTAGDTVDVFTATDGRASLLAADVEVRCSFNAQGAAVQPGVSGSGLYGLKTPGTAVPAVVELMVPASRVQAVVENNRNIYLVRVR